MREIFKRIASFFKEEEGATAVEYALMVALIAAVIIAAVSLLGQESANTFNKVKDSMANATN
jgi:pilus assembly protein Flp/PilA